MKKIVVIAMLTGMVYLFAGCEKWYVGEPIDVDDASFGFQLLDKKTLGDYFFVTYGNTARNKLTYTKLTDEYKNEYTFGETDKGNEFILSSFPFFGSFYETRKDTVEERLYYLKFHDGDLDTIRITFQMHPQYGKRWGETHYFLFVNAYYNGELQYENTNSSEVDFFAQFLK